ncbi:MAG: VOC family protein [Planctomycetota bacterium]
MRVAILTAICIAATGASVPLRAQSANTSSADLLFLLSKPAIDLVVVTGDLDRAVKFYHDGVGMKAVGERTKLQDGTSLQRLQHGRTVFYLLAPRTAPKLGPRIAADGDDE